MNCQDVQEKLLAHRVGELDDAAAAALHQHLETCAACRAAAEETERVLDLMRSALAAGPAAPAQLDNQHRNRVLRAQFTWAGYRNIILEIAAVILVSTVMIGLLLPAAHHSKGKAQLALAQARQIEKESSIAQASDQNQVAEAAKGQGLAKPAEQLFLFDAVAPAAAAPVSESTSRFSTLARAEHGSDRKAADKAPADTLQNLESERTWGALGTLAKRDESAKQLAPPPPVMTAPPAKPAAGNEVVLGSSGAGFIKGNVSGVGAVTKSGSGTLTLEGANTYAGATVINAGTLVVNATAVTDGRASGGGVEADKKAPTAQPGISGATTYRKGGGGGEWFKADGAVTVSGGSGEGSVAVSDLNGTAMSLGGKVVSAGKPVYFDNYAVQNPDASRNALAADPEGRHDTNGRGEQRGNTVDLAGWAESGPKQPDQKNLTVVNGEPMMPLRTELPKPMLAGTPVALPNVMVVQKDAQKLSERLKEVADAPVAGLKADTAEKSFYAWSDEAKKLSEHRKSVDELRSASTATAAAPTTPAPDEQLERGREVTPPVGTVVVSGGNLNFNGGTLDAGYVNGPGAVSGEKALAKAKEAKGALRQEEQAADTSGRNSFAYQLAGGVLASPVSETKPTGEKVTRGLANADDWAVDAIAPAKAPADWSFASKQQELELASQVKVLKGAAKGYGGRFGSAGLGRGGRVTDAEVETDGEHKEAAGREFRAYDARKKDLAALGDVSKMTGKDSDSDGTVLKAGDTLDLGRLAKHEHALEETEKTRRLNVLTMDADEKSQSEKPAALKPAEKVAQQRATASRTELGLELREEDDAGLKKALGENRKDGRDESTTAKPIFRAAGVNPWLAVNDQSFSTFSISVDSASFTLARRYLNGGQRPPPESVRTEEFVNYFDYGYAPPGRDLFSVHAAAARTPFCPPGVQLLKLGIKGRQIGREDRGANLTFLLDTSGSMNAPDRLDLARDALKLLLAKLGPLDRVALVTFSSRARLVLDFTPASERQKIFAALDGIQAAGFTHLEGGLKRAYETAARGFVSGASNRVILMSDGVANVGADAAAELLAQVEKYRKQGLFCSVFGLGTGTYDDTMLQALASKGNGSYLFMDSLDEARRVFVDEFAATLNKIASDVKIQVEFNPRRVKQYRQLGYEQRQLKTEDFRNDAVAAGEVGSGQSVTALYQVELQGDPNEPLGTVRVRGRNLETGRVEELERAITANDLAPSFERADVRFQLAAAAAQFAEILRGSPYAEGASCADVAKVLRPIALELSLDQKVQELLRLVTAAGGAPQASE